MLLAVHDRVMEHLGSLESTQGYASGNSYVSFVLSKLPTCSITRWCTLKHEPIVNHQMKARRGWLIDYRKTLFGIEMNFAGKTNYSGLARQHNGALCGGDERFFSPTYLWLLSQSEEKMVPVV